MSNENSTSDDVFEIYEMFAQNQLRLSLWGNYLTQTDPMSSEEDKRAHERNVKTKWQKFSDALKFRR